MEPAASKVTSPSPADVAAWKSADVEQQQHSKGRVDVRRNNWRWCCSAVMTADRVSSWKQQRHQSTCCTQQQH